MIDEALSHSIRLLNTPSRVSTSVKPPAIVMVEPSLSLCTDAVDEVVLVVELERLRCSKPLSCSGSTIGDGAYRSSAVLDDIVGDTRGDGTGERSPTEPLTVLVP